jgi:hypothetical protein
MNSEEARAILAEEQKARMQAFTDELGALCEKHQCSLSAVPSISLNGSIVAEIRVVPR